MGILVYTYMMGTALNLTKPNSIEYAHVHFVTIVDSQSKPMEGLEPKNMWMQLADTGSCLQ